MALRINTNIASLNAHKNMINTDNRLSSSLERLSSGLRINKAADDASGMAIADSLKSQGLGLGQAIRNANDGISIVQTADGALEESINIVNTIKTKAIQAAQDGQTMESRKAIQADINKLLEQLDNTAKTTSFNGQKLLSGQFTNKKFQIGAFAGETVNIGVQSTEATKIGHITTSTMSFSGPGAAQLEIYSNLKDQTFSIQAIELAYNNNAGNGVGAVADAINKLSDSLGISATASVTSTTAGSVAAGTTDSRFAINGVTIGALNVKANDSDGALVAAINKKTSEHGVTASVDQKGFLTLTSTDNRAIQVTMGDATRRVMGGTQNMSTLGQIELRQEGTSEISIKNVNPAGGVAVSTLEGGIMVSDAVDATQSFIAAHGSILASGTKLGSGSVIGGTFTLNNNTGGDTIKDSLITAGSILAASSQIACGTVLKGSFSIQNNTGTSKDGSIVKAGSFLASSTTLDGFTRFKGDVSAALSAGGTGTIIVTGSGDNLYTWASGGINVKAGGLTLTDDALIGEGTSFMSGTVLTTGSKIYDDILLFKDGTVTGDMILTSGSNLTSGSVLKTGSYLTGIIMSGSGFVEGNMLLTMNTVLADKSFLTDGSSLGASATIAMDITVGTNANMSVGKGTTLASGTILAAGTLITTELTDEKGFTYKAGTLLTKDIKLSGSQGLSADMVLTTGSVLTTGTELAKNEKAVAEFSSAKTTMGGAYRLSDVDVTTQEGAQIGIAVADSALKDLDKVRSDLGSTQNQLTSFISNLSVTRVNVFSAESTIRDVDFAEEASNFTKMQVLSQAGTFAMAQANASAQQVMSLLQ